MLMSIACKAQHSNQRRQGKALQYKRDQDSAESQKDNHIPLHKRTAIFKCLWQRDGGGQGNDAAHSCPANYKYLASSRHGFILMKDAPANQIGEIRAGKEPDHSQQNEKSAEYRAIYHQRSQMVVLNGAEHVR